jgi:uncharacterized glyoxalase superfamily protein PhnB
MVIEPGATVNEQDARPAASAARLLAENAGQRGVEVSVRQIAAHDISRISNHAENRTKLIPAYHKMLFLKSIPEYQFNHDLVFCGLMVTNRSVPADAVLPHLTCRDVAAASAWLAEVFGFTEHYRYGPPEAPSGAQLYLGDAWIMLETADDGQKTPAELGYGTQSLTIFVPDVDAHFSNSKSAGATIVEDLHETMYGERQYGALDLDGHHWLFSAHARDVDPADWGAIITSPPAP